jgi:ADP-ribosylglycohydrolase
MDSRLAGATSDQRDRAVAAMTGVALGDALGMPTQTLTPTDIVRNYGEVVDFVAPYPGHPVSHGLGAAMVTDDTEQSLLLALQILAHRDRFDDRAWADALLGWERSVRDRGLRDLLGPSTRSALAALQAGIPADQVGLRGTTNGAAMRIVPVGIATPPGDLMMMVDRVAETCRLTHNTGEAIAAAAAVATVVSLGIDGASFAETCAAAQSAARLGNQHGAATGERDMAGRIALALAQPDVSSLVAAVGTSVDSRASVAAAFGVVRLAGGDPWAAALIAANIGDDTDTIGAIAVGMAGSCTGLAAFPADKVQRVLQVNGMSVGPLVDRLLGLRYQRLGQGGAVAS